MIQKFYTGIGSRETPRDVEALIRHLVESLNVLGYTLRSGGAEGADSFFEKHSASKEIFLPWRNFNNKSNLYSLSQDAIELAKKYHPNYDRLSSGGKALMARNGYQVLGRDLKTPSEFVICWTKDGGPSGGTGQAIRIAMDNDIRVFNLKNDIDIISLNGHINKLNTDTILR